MTTKWVKDSNSLLLAKGRFGTKCVVTRIINVVVNKKVENALKVCHSFRVVHANGKTFSVSHPFLHFGGGSFGVW